MYKIGVLDERILLFVGNGFVRSKLSPAHVLTLLALMLLAPIASVADTVFVSNAGNNTIEKFSPDGAGSVFASTGLNIPLGLAFDNLGNLFVANYGNKTIGLCTSRLCRNGW